jgi:TonB family protein
MPGRGHSRIRVAGVLGLAMLVAFGVASAGQAAPRSAAIVGTVRDAQGRAIADVELRVLGSGLRAHSDDRGEYRITGLAPGAATLTARRLGFSSHSSELRLEAGEERRVEIVLAVVAETLETVSVTAPHEVYDARLAGFNARSKRQVGHFVTRERIERANNARLSDVLREIPGVRLGSVWNAGGGIRIRRADCPPLVFLDGVPASAGAFDVDMIDLHSVEGIEVYSGSATIPSEFSGPRDLDRCGVIAIWSRPARPRVRAVAAEAPRDSVPADLGEVYTRDQVETSARLDSGSLAPSYPDSLYRAGVGGQVVVEFIVDTTGAVEAESVDVLQSSNPLFTMAARAALALGRFEPARLHGRRVRQVVQLPFNFTPPPPSPQD